MSEACTYCGSNIYEHKALFVDEQRDGERETVSQFCNYACLAQHIKDEGLETGACCQVDFA